MKNAIVLIVLFFLSSLSVQAQKTATWKGGTPGRNSDWNCPTNWNEGRVPNEYSKVIIPDVSTSTYHYPVIHKGTVEISSLECSPAARLTLLGNARIIEVDNVQSPNAQKRHAQINLNADTLIAAKHQ